MWFKFTNFIDIIQQDMHHDNQTLFTYFGAHAMLDTQNNCLFYVSFSFTELSVTRFEYQQSYQNIKWAFVTRILTIRNI